MLADTEVDVRKAVVESMCQTLSAGYLISADKILTHIVPCIQAMYVEAAPNFKESLATGVCEIIASLGKERAVPELMSMVAELMKDENSGVRVNVAEGLKQVALSVGPSVMDAQIVQSLKELKGGNNWRVRLAVYDLLGELGKTFGRSAFSEELEEMFVDFMADNAKLVRETGIAKCVDIAKVFGPHWITEVIVSKAVSVFEEEK